MTHARAGDELGAAAWRGARWGVLGARRPANEARATGDPVSIANGRNALNHAWTIVLAVVALLVLTPLVILAVGAFLGDPRPPSWTVVLPMLGALGGMALRAQLDISQGIEAARRGEIHRVRQTIPLRALSPLSARGARARDGSRADAAGGSRRR